MKGVVKRLYHRFDREVIERQIEEELRFHLELLTEQHLQQEMSFAEAKDAALKRFGNVEQIKDQCVEISRSNRPLIRVLKSFLILVFLVGVLVRVFSVELNVTQVGNTLILVAVLGRLFFYVRGLNPSRFTSKDEPSCPLMLNENGPKSFTTYDQKKRTPLERVISDS
ncbi:MAG: permease prefix domain 1-containing protein [Pyrinomonadaceae bacterium]